jgi:hypothetical protein
MMCGSEIENIETNSKVKLSNFLQGVGSRLSPPQKGCPVHPASLSAVEKLPDIK